MGVPALWMYLSELAGTWDAAPDLIQLSHTRNAFYHLRLHDGNSHLHFFFQKLLLLLSIHLSHILVLFRFQKLNFSTQFCNYFILPKQHTENLLIFDSEYTNINYYLLVTVDKLLQAF